MKLIRALLIPVVLLVGMSGCSIKMLYNNADRFARWAANDYIRMDDDQEAYFTSEVKVIHYWHRTSELPRYADYLETLPGTVEAGVEEEDVQALFDTVYGWWEAVERKALPMITELALSLSDEQVARLPERFEKDNRDLSEDEAGEPLEEIQEEWAKQYTSAMSRFTGKLNRTQKDYVAAQSVRYVPQFELWAEYRERWQADLLHLLREKREDPEVFAEAFKWISENREAYYGEELSAVFDANEALAAEVTAWLLNHLTDAQREKFYERIGDLAATFRELSAQIPDRIPVGGGCLVRC